MNCLARFLQFTFAALISPYALACSPNPNYVPPSIKAETARASSIVVATIADFTFWKDPKPDNTSSSLRDGKFLVLFSLKGTHKAGDVVHVLDDSSPCSLSFSTQITSDTNDGRWALVTSNTWVLFLSGKPPYKLWESPRSGPLNEFSTEEMRGLFLNAPRPTQTQVQPNPSLERP